jgi:glycosyltransferase involved in cell wall biosynthesis
VVPVSVGDDPGTACRLLVATTSPITAHAFLRDQLPYLAQRGWDIHLVTSDGPYLNELQAIAGIDVHVVPMCRTVSVVADALALIRWIRLLRHVKPGVVMTSTPKAGLLGVVAAALVRTRYRIYLVRGLRAEGLKGPAGTISRITEWLSCRLATSVVCVSNSLLSRLVSAGLCPADKATVIGSGSSNGVDTAHFQPATAMQRGAARRVFGIGPDTPTLGFVGRLTEDKGIDLLINAARAIRNEFPDLRLLVVGAEDLARPLPPAVRSQLGEPWIIETGHLDDPVPAYHAMDVFVFPSHREGFPNGPLEASACGLPVITSAATGFIDAVDHGETGFVVDSDSVSSWGEAVATLVRDEKARTRLGQQGRARVLSSYQDHAVWANLNGYLRLIVGA